MGQNGITRRTALQLSGRLLSGGLLVGSLLAAPHVRAASTRKVIFASVGGMTDAGLYLAREMGFFAEVGLDVDMQRLSSAPDLMAATASSQVDVAGISLTPGVFAAVERGVGLRLVGDKQSLRPGFSASRLIVRNDLVRDNEAAVVAALRGRKIAVSAKASALYMTTAALLAKYGMSVNDVTIIELAYPNMATALSTGAIDAAADLEPFATQAIQAKLGKAVCDFTEFVPAKGGSIVPLVYSEDFTHDRARAQDFMTAYVRGVRVYNDAFAKGIDKDKVIDIIARQAKLPVQLVRDCYPGGLDPDQVLDPAFYGRVEDFFIQQGLLQKRIDPTKVIDASFAAAAVKQLGPYA
jgi:NitT/TauT family transport system substrate-binding protein